MQDEDNYLERTIQELGPPQAEYSTRNSRMWTRIIIGVLLLLYGVGANYYWWVHGPRNFNHFALMVLFIPPGMGISLLWLVFKTLGQNILVYPMGLFRVQQNQFDSFPWSEFKELRIKADSGTMAQQTSDGGHLESCWLEIPVPKFQLWNLTLRLSREDETTLTLTPVLANFAELMKTVQVDSFKALWPSVWNRYLAGEELVFGAFTLSVRGLTHGKNHLGWQDTISVQIQTKKLTISREGKWLSWAKDDLEAIPNPHIFLALIQESRKLYGVATRLPVAEETQESDGPGEQPPT